jgi:hypothetical protein
MSGKYALIIGNTEYTDPRLAQLTAPGKDAEDFARVLKDQNICAFDEVKILLNQPSSSVIEAVDEFFDQKKHDDLLVLYFSGHGIKDELGALFLAFKNTIRSRLRSTAIKSDYIREAMDQSRSRRQVVFLDCCNSGAFPQGTKAEVGGLMGMTMAFQGYGRYVLTASDATQYAWEGDKIIGETDNSLFTHFLVKGLEGDADSDGDGKITVDELYDYAYEEISKVTPKQTPTKGTSKQEGEIVLRQMTRIEDVKPVPLPAPLVDSMENLLADIRLGAVQQLTKLLNGKNLGLARSARAALERIVEEDDSRMVSHAASQALEAIRRAEQLAKQKAEEEQLAAQKLEAERKAQEEAERLLDEQRAKERIAKAQMEGERRAEEKRLAAEEAEARRRAKEDAERLEREHLAAKMAEKERQAQREKADPDLGASEKAQADLAWQQPEQALFAQEQEKQERLAREKVEARPMLEQGRQVAGLQIPANEPSYWKAVGSHLLLGFGLFYVDNSLRRKWLYPIFPLYAILDYFLGAMLHVPPFAAIFGPVTFIGSLVIYALSFVDVIWSCRTRRKLISGRDVERAAS